MIYSDHDSFGSARISASFEEWASLAAETVANQKATYDKRN